MTAAAVDLTVAYLGLSLRSPLIASASPLTGDVESARRLAGAGVGALVLPSLFEEEIEAEEIGLAAALEAGAEDSPEAHGFFPPIEGATVADRYLANLERIKAAVDIPVIASLNATSVGAWSRYAALAADAGADAVELNVYRVAANPYLAGTDVESADLELIAEVCQASTVPVAVKLSPYYSAMADFTRQVIKAGAAGLVLFNRFMQNDIDPDTLTVGSDLSLSSPVEAGLPRSWIARLRGRVPISLAATTGVESARDVAAYLLAGADVVMTTSSLLRHGAEHADDLLEGLQAWMQRKGFESVEQVRGRLATAAGVDPSEYGRPSYLTTIEEATRTYAPA